MTKKLFQTYVHRPRCRVENVIVSTVDLNFWENASGAVEQMLLVEKSRSIETMVFVATPEGKFLHMLELDCNRGEPENAEKQHNEAVSRWKQHDAAFEDIPHDPHDDPSEV